MTSRLLLLAAFLSVWSSNVYADCSAILKGDLLNGLEASKLKAPSFKRTYQPYEIKSELGLKLNPLSPETQTQIQEKRGHSKENFDKFFEMARAKVTTKAASEISQSASGKPNPMIMDSWIRMNLSRSESIDSILQLSEQLESAVQLPIVRYIYVLIPNVPDTPSNYIFRVAPLTLSEDNGSSYTKHVALAEERSVLAAGELTLDRTQTPRRFLFDLKSGTYMSSAAWETQYEICRAVESYLKEWIGSTWQVEFNTKSIEDIRRN